MEAKKSKLIFTLLFITMHVILLFVLRALENDVPSEHKDMQLALLLLGILISVSYWICQYRIFSVLYKTENVSLLDKLISAQNLGWVITILTYAVLVYVSQENMTGIGMEGTKYLLIFLLDFMVCEVGIKFLSKSRRSGKTTNSVYP